MSRNTRRHLNPLKTKRTSSEAPSDEEYLKIIQPILDSITGVAEDDWNDAITDLWKQQKEIEKKIEILKSNYESITPP